VLAESSRRRAGLGRRHGLGLRAPGWFGLFACGPTATSSASRKLSFKEQTDYQIGYAVGLICRKHGMTSAHLLAGDDQMWQKTGVSSPTLAEASKMACLRRTALGLGVGAATRAAEKGKGFTGGKASS